MVTGICSALAASLALACLSGCASGSGGEQMTEAAPASAMPDWRSIATESDRERLREWRTAWMRGVTQAKGGGHAGELAREGNLLNPDAAVEWQDPPPGEYSCRMIKVGAKGAGPLDYIAYPAFTCRIRQEHGMMSFAKLTGSQRPLGLFLPTQGNRMVFLGTLQLGDENRAMEYGRDRERDMAGVVERIGDNRWRLFFPYPHFESTIDVLELVPAATAS